MGYFKVKLTIASLLVATMTLTACGGATTNAYDISSNTSSPSGSSGESPNSETIPGGVTLNFIMKNENYTQALQNTIQRWERKSGNKINIIMTTDPTTAVSTQIMSGDVDLFRGEGTRYAETQWPTDYFYDMSNEEWVRRLTDAAKRSITWTDGTIRGIPISSAEYCGVLYRRSIFEQAGIKEVPTTWDDFLDDCQKIKDNTDAYPVHWSSESGSEFCAYHMTQALFSNVYISRGLEATEQLFKDIDAHKVKWSNINEYKEALEQMCELRDKGYTNDDAISCSFDTEVERIGSGAAAMTVCGNYIMDPLLQAYPDIEDDLGYFSMPFGDTSGSLPLCTYPGIHIAYNSSHLEAAIDFINYFCSKENQEIYNEETPGYNMFNDVETSGNFLYQYVAENEDRVFTEVDEAGVYAWPDDTVRRCTQEMIEGSITPVDFLSAMDDESEVQMKALEKEGW